MIPLHSQSCFRLIVRLEIKIQNRLPKLTPIDVSSSVSLYFPLYTCFCRPSQHKRLETERVNQPDPPLRCYPRQSPSNHPHPPTSSAYYHHISLTLFYYSGQGNRPCLLYALPALFLSQTSCFVPATVPSLTVSLVYMFEVTPSIGPLYGQTLEYRAPPIGRLEW